MMLAKVISSPTLREEQSLLDHVTRLQRRHHGRRALHLHLSRLQRQNRRPAYLLAASSMFNTPVQTYHGQLFRLANGDIVFIGQDVPEAALAAVVEKVRSLFVEDPLAHAKTQAGADQFCTHFNLTDGYAGFREHVDRLIAAAEAALAAAPRRPQAVPEKPLRAVRPSEIEHIQEALLQADLSGIVRRQPICAVLPGAAPQPVWYEVYVSVADLARLVAPGVDLAANRWLFQLLTESLDRRVLSLLPRWNDAALEGRLSINLNLSTVLSPSFLAFDAGLKVGARGSYLIELQAFDALADAGDFAVARAFLRERGYALCLDGLSQVSATLVNMARFDVDFLKLTWKRQMLDATDERHAALARSLRAMGLQRAILCRCDMPVGVEYGQSLGITLFQGRYIDQLLASGQPHRLRTA
jgi:EAL domain-containing protein (putative c-di-GMP-specific phosphodiesterase class I)